MHQLILSKLIKFVVLNHLQFNRHWYHRLLMKQNLVLVPEWRMQAPNNCYNRSLLVVPK